MISGTFLDVHLFPGIVKSSNLLLRHPNTSVDVVEGLEGALRKRSRNKSLPGRPRRVPEWLKIVFSCSFLYVNHFQTIIKRSNLLLRHRNTSVDVAEGLEEALRNTLKLATREQARVASAHP